MPGSNTFSTINIKLLADNTKLTSGLGKASGEFKAFAVNLGKEAKSAFSESGGFDLTDIGKGSWGNLYKSAIKSLKGAGPLGAAVGGAIDIVGGTIAKTHESMTAPERERERLAKEAAEEKAQALAAERQHRFEMIKGLGEVNKELFLQATLFDQASTKSALYSVKLDMIRSGLLSAKTAFDVPKNGLERQARFQFWPDLVMAEFQDEKNQKLQRAKDIRGGLATPTENFFKQLNEAQDLLGRKGGLSPVEFGRKAFGLMESLDRLNPQSLSSNPFAAAIKADSVDAARASLRAQQGAAGPKDVVDRLKDAIDRARVIEEEQLREQEKLREFIERGGLNALNVANF